MRCGDVVEDAAFLEQRDLHRFADPGIDRVRSRVSRNSRMLITRTAHEVPASSSSEQVMLSSPDAGIACARTVVGMRIARDAAVLDGRGNRLPFEHGAAAR